MMEVSGQKSLVKGHTPTLRDNLVTYGDNRPFSVFLYSDMSPLTVKSQDYQERGADQDGYMSSSCFPRRDRTPFQV